MRLIGLAGWSGAGKTTLIDAADPRAAARGVVVSTLKHAHHAFDIDQPGKDSYQHREAGAREVLVSSASRWALMNELRGAPEPTLAELLRRLDAVDLVIVEGFKRDAHPKIEVHRGANGKPWLHPDDPLHRRRRQRRRRRRMPRLPRVASRRRRGDRRPGAGRMRSRCEACPRRG